MPEQIYKLQPNRTVHLRGFDSLGASAAVHSSTANGFQVSGNFRDAADFAVVVLYDADNFFEHPRLRYLPDFDFSGLTLQFDVSYSGLMPLDSPKYASIDWPFLDFTLADEDSTPARRRLFDFASQVGGSYTAASGSVTVSDSTMKEGDHFVLWYLNYPFEYTVRKIECAYFWAGTPGPVHWIDVDGVRYQTTEIAGDTTSSIIDRLVAALNAGPRVTAVNTGGFQIDLRNSSGDGAAYTVAASASTNVFTLYGESADFIATFLAGQIAGAYYPPEILPLTATASGTTLNLQCGRPGVDGNFIAIYTNSSSSRLTWDKDFFQLSGGSSSATWRVTLNFSSLGVTDIRKMWLTFAPPLRYAAAIDPMDWQATFTNWIVTESGGNKWLQVAGPGSIRVEETDRWCTYNREWTPTQDGFFSGGFAKVASAIEDQVTIQYACASTHDLYVGTSLYVDRASVDIFIDGVLQPVPLNCRLVEDAQVVTRRRIASGVAAGEHTVTLRQRSAGVFYFDFLEAAVRSDVPDALPAVSTFSPALDYSTDHTYKLSPARLMWSFDKLGFTGPMNEYLGVFWWNQRQRVGGSIPSATVTFSGSFVPGDAIYLNIGGQEIRKSVFRDENPAIFATHFASSINAMYVGVYAVASGSSVTITTRSPKPEYAYPLSWRVEPPSSSGVVSISGSLLSAVEGTWEVDPAQLPPLNRGARAWLADMFGECKARDREITVASSMELVNPPPSFAAVYPDGEAVQTHVGYADLHSTHCAFSSPMLEYQQRVFANVAALMSAALLTPSLQLGEFVWWFFTNWTASNTDGGMAFYDTETMADAAVALGRPLHRFTQPNDDPGVNGGADAVFLRNRLRDYVATLVSYVKASYSTAQFEVLFPYDVAHPVPAGVNNLGGALNRFVCFPMEWESKATSGFDRLKIEALDFGSSSRDLNLCRTAVEFPLSLDWPRSSIRYLMPVFRPGGSWQKEYLLARGREIPIVNFWAYDHFCLYAIDPREPKNRGSASTF